MRAQCTRSAHAVHVQRTCSAHAAHVQCTCSARAVHVQRLQLEQVQLQLALVLRGGAEREGRRLLQLRHAEQRDERRIAAGMLELTEVVRLVPG